MNSESTAEPAIEIRNVDGVYGVVATRALCAGQLILSSTGVVTRKPTRYSIQIGENSHIDLPTDVTPEISATSPADELKAMELFVQSGFAWRFLNHSCAPCAKFEGPDLIAVRDIAAGEAITFNYNATEYELAEPFLCHCGACTGASIAGFKHLTRDEQLELAGVLAPYLTRRLDAGRG